MKNEVKQEVKKVKIQKIPLPKPKIKQIKSGGKIKKVNIKSEPQILSGVPTPKYLEEKGGVVKSKPVEKVVDELIEKR